MLAGVRFVQMGIIPALAGNTPLLLVRHQPTQDHPRSRGEYAGVKFGLVWALGSSPLSRGILASMPVSMPMERIIPALAGNTHERRVISAG